MMFTRSFSTREEFAAIWPRSVDTMADLYERRTVMPDYRYELSHDALQRTRAHAAPNEIERAIRRLWTFDDRFHGNMIGGGKSDYIWAVYVLVYLGQSSTVVEQLLTTYVPLLGGYAVREFGENWCRKVCSTFMDDAGHMIWDVQEARYPRNGDFFDWHGHLANRSEPERRMFLDFAGVPPLRHPSFPTAPIMSRMMDSVHLGAPSSTAMHRMMVRFYRSIGHVVD
jgi:hypothetical protein